MSAAKLPLKYSLVKYMNGKASITAKEFFERAQPDYGNEKQLTLGNVEGHLESLRAAGLIETVDIELDGAGDLNCSYKLTGYGHSRLKKYIPEG